MSFLVQIEIKTLYDSKINAAEDPADSNKPQAGVKKKMEQILEGMFHLQIPRKYTCCQIKCLSSFQHPFIFLSSFHS